MELPGPGSGRGRNGKWPTLRVGFIFFLVEGGGGIWRCPKINRGEGCTTVNLQKHENCTARELHLDKAFLLKSGCEQNGRTDVAVKSASKLRHVNSRGEMTARGAILGHAGRTKRCPPVAVSRERHLNHVHPTEGETSPEEPAAA